MKEEGFLGVDIPYTDNSNCVLALDSKISVFTILNEVSVFTVSKINTIKGIFDLYEIMKIILKVVQSY